MGVDQVEELDELLLAMLAVHLPMISPVATFKAANKVVVP